MFDRFVTVDWSANNRPKVGPDSIWICNLGAEGCQTVNPRTRGDAEARVRSLLVDALARRERVLVGFDFPYAYPRGFAQALGLAGEPWRAVWRYLADAIDDDPRTNRSNRFAVASAINARLAAHAFWGRPSGQLFDHLSAKRDQVRYRIEAETVGLAEWREVERLLRSRGGRPHSAWKLLGAGCVGSQALTGIPVVARLRDDPGLAGVSRVWPFEVRVPPVPPGEPAVVHAEIWPSLAPVPSTEGRVKDEAQVVQVARELRDRDAAGTLAEAMAAPPSDAAEEGWILGVE